MLHTRNGGSSQIDESTVVYFDDSLIHIDLFPNRLLNFRFFFCSRVAFLTRFIFVSLLLLVFWVIYYFRTLSSTHYGVGLTNNESNNINSHSQNADTMEIIFEKRALRLACDAIIGVIVINALATNASGGNVNMNIAVREHEKFSFNLTIRTEHTFTNRNYFNCLYFVDRDVVSMNFGNTYERRCTGIHISRLAFVAHASQSVFALRPILLSASVFLLLFHDIACRLGVR